MHVAWSQEINFSLREGEMPLASKVMVMCCLLKRLFIQLYSMISCLQSYLLEQDSTDDRELIRSKMKWIM